MCELTSLEPNHNIVVFGHTLRKRKKKAKKRKKDKNASSITLTMETSNTRNSVIMLITKKIQRPVQVFFF
jgi:hypothetical protein